MIQTTHHRTRWSGLAISSTLLFLLLSAPALAQTERPLFDLDLEDLMQVDVQSVFGASKFLQKVTDAPATVSVVTALDIELYGYRTLADIIRTAPGFNVTYDRDYSYIGVRGFQRPGDFNSRVLVAVDGHRLNDPVYNMAFLGTEFPLDVELIDRVELIRGPSSSIYGTNAFFAVVNVVTKKGATLSGAEISFDGGSLDTGRGRAAFGAAFNNGVDVLLSASRYRSGGNKRLYFPEFDSPATNNGIAENLDNDDDFNLFASVSFKGLSFQSVFGSRDKRVPTAAFGTWFNDSNAKTHDAQGWGDLRYIRELPGKVQFTGRVYYDRDYYKGRYPSNDSETDQPSISIFEEYVHAQWWGAEVNLEKVIAQRHRVTAGGEYRDNFKIDQGGFDVASGAVALDDRRSAHDSAVFIEDQYSISDKFLLNAGVRSDRYQAFGRTTNPRVALIFKPAEKTAIKALWGTAFRAPNAYELYYVTTAVKGNPKLNPEKIRTGEVVFERYFLNHYRLMANAYNSHVRGLISQVVDPDGLLVFLNLNSAATRGFETEFEAKWSTGIGGRVSYSYQKAKDRVTNKPLVNSARHLATGNLTVPLFRRQIFAGMDVNFVGPVETLSGSFTDWFAVPNLTVSSRELYKGVSLSANVYNLFDSKYGYPGGDEHRQNIIYQDGRTFRFGLKFTQRMKK